MVEIMIVVSIIGILAMIGAPVFMRAIDDSREEVCIMNQRSLVQARNEWALEYRRPVSAIPAGSDVAPYIKSGLDKCFCPLDADESFDTSYQFNDFDDSVMCKITPAHDEDDQW